MGREKGAEEISDLSEQLQLKRIHEVSEGPEEKRMKPSDFAEYDDLLNELARELQIARHPDPLVLLRAARLLIRDHCPSSNSIFSQAKRDCLKDKNLDPTADGDQREAQLVTARDGQKVGASGIRVQQTKFTLDDIVLPRSLIKSGKNNLAKQECESSQRQQVPSTGPAVCMSHETRSTESMTTGAKDESLIGLERAAKALKLLYMDDQRQLQNQVNELISKIQSITANPKTDPRLLATGR